MNQPEFKGKVAVITGAGIGIGYEIARQLALNGASVVLNDIDEAAALAAVQKIHEEGGTCMPLVGDSGDIDIIHQIIDAAVSTYGKLDLAIANAGITSFGSFLDYPIEHFQQVLNVNLQGTFFLAQQAARQMVAQKSGGSILLLSSVTGHQFHPELAAYGMTKAAIRFLAKYLGVELAPMGINVNAISPGAIVTERTVKLDDGAYTEMWERTTPVGRPGTTEDIAHAALFLLSPRSGFITSHTLISDGGWTAVSPPPQ